MARRLRPVWAAVFLAAAACAPNAPQDTLNPAADVARRIDALFNPVFWIAAAIFFLVEGALLVAVLKFRDRPGAKMPKQVHGNTRLEVTWTILPAILLAAVAVPTVATLWSLAQEPAGDVLQIEVVGHQWWWEYRYTEEGVVTANELHIPTGRPVRAKLTSAESAASEGNVAAPVIHSFWIPRLAGKQDVVPGRTNYLTFSAETPGEYMGQCVEFCGLSHANMRLRVFAHDPGEFDDWVADQQRTAAAPTAGDAAEGKRVFEEGQCVNCHTIRGTPARGSGGPDLTHMGSRTTLAGAMIDNTPEEMARWLRDPPGVKPGSRMPNYGLTDEQITALVAYMQSLR